MPGLRSARNALTVFFLSGLLLALPGAILPVWGYHLSDEFLIIGDYFLAVAAGILLSVKIGDALHRKKPVQTMMTWGASLASISLVAMAVFAPPAHWLFRAGALLLLGIAAGLLNSSAFQSISTLFEQDPAATVNLAGALFGSGCFAAALAASSTFYLFQRTGTLIPILFGLLLALASYFYRHREFAEPVAHSEKSHEIWAEVKSPGAVLFSMLLFFQSGSEWAVAGWLAILLVHNTGVNPATGLLMLSVYYLALLSGRIVAQSLLSRVGHGKLLLSSSFAALLGSLILAFTNNTFGAWVGVLLLGGGFAMIYPLAVEKIGHRFPNYHPGFYNGIFSIGLVGGLLAPWSLGYLANYLGIGAVMVIPFLGTCMVFLLTILIWIEARLAAPPSR